MNKSLDIPYKISTLISSVVLIIGAVLIFTFSKGGQTLASIDDKSKAMACLLVIISTIQLRVFYKSRNWFKSIDEDDLLTTLDESIDPIVKPISVRVSTSSILLLFVSGLLLFFTFYMLFFEFKWNDNLSMYVYVLFLLMLINSLFQVHRSILIIVRSRSKS